MDEPNVICCHLVTAPLGAMAGEEQWPWADGGAWEADVRAALRAWLQEHKRELGFLGQRQLEQAAAGCSCSQYVATQRPAAAG